MVSFFAECYHRNKGAQPQWIPVKSEERKEKYYAETI